MPGKCFSIALSLVAGLMTASVHMRAAEAAPAWLALVTVPAHASGFGYLGADSPAAAELAEQAAPPNASAMSDEELCAALVSSARERGLPLSFFTKLIWQESRFDSRTVSRAGAEGIAQFMPTMAKEIGLEDPFDPRQAIPAAARLLRRLVDKFGNVGLAAAAYNAGPSRVRAWIAKRGKLPAETRDYVVTITGRAADTWRGRKSVATARAMPSAVPCLSIATFAAATSSEHTLAMEPRRATSLRAATRPAQGRRGARLRVAALKPRDRARKKG